MARGEAEFAFQVPDDLSGLNIQELKLAFFRDNAGQFAVPEISLYHWEEERWDEIQNPIDGTNIISNGSDYVNENGLINVRLNNENDMYSCFYVDMGLEADSTSGAGEQP